MKKTLLKWWMVLGFILWTARAGAQTFEVQQLLLDIEKLTQLKHILQDLKDGYQILEKSYSTVRDLMHGNFDLHKAYLDGLLLVNPAVRNHPEVREILDMQTRMVAQIRGAQKRFRGERFLTPAELAHLENVYNNIHAESSKQLDELMLILTDSKLRMSDEERLHVITLVYTDVQGQDQFLRQFNKNTLLLVNQRAREGQDIGTLEHLYAR